ncbi:MAG TPA: hypothetical protein VFO51_09265 [Sphingomicrobium sp.]|nr:hypothetical protein [Sphingomicrobium sp.]
MKTIYTDRYAVRVWIWLFLGAWFLFNALTPPADWRAAVWLAGSAFWFWLAFKEVARRRALRRRGDDPTIYRVFDDA